MSGSSTKSKNVDLWNIEEKQKTAPKKHCFYKTKKGQHIAKRKGRIVVEKRQDKREVLMLSTHYSGKMVESNRQTKGGQKKKKPKSLVLYNNFLCGVDRMDQLMS